MINLPNYEPIKEPYITLREYNEALQEKTGNIVSCKLAARLLDGNNASLRIANTKGNWLDVARFVPSFNEVNYPATMTLAVGVDMLGCDDAEFLDGIGWDLDCEYPRTAICNPEELGDALDAIFQLDFVTTAICELMANRPRITI
jgi:hypothetical protein